ncbi:X-ray repair cross-complementing protein 5 [Plecturocebus cupreus]
MFVQRQVFAENKDKIALVLFGMDGTENPPSGGDQYQNITVHRHLMLSDFDLLEDIESKIQPGSQQADFLDALIVSMDVIQHETTGKKFEKRHIALTSAADSAKDGITLITKEEASGSSVTAEEAKKFLAPKEKPSEDTAALFEEGGDVDDLLDMI